MNATILLTDRVQSCPVKPRATPHLAAHGLGGRPVTGQAEPHLIQTPAVILARNALLLNQLQHTGALGGLRFGSATGPRWEGASPGKPPARNAGRGAARGAGPNHVSSCSSFCESMPSVQLNMGPLHRRNWPYRGRGRIPVRRDFGSGA